MNPTIKEIKEWNFKNCWKEVDSLPPYAKKVESFKGPWKSFYYMDGRGPCQYWRKLPNGKVYKWTGVLEKPVEAASDYYGENKYYNFKVTLT